MKKLKIIVYSIILIFVMYGCVGNDENDKLVVKFISFGEVVENIKVKKGDIVDEPILPIKEGYSFFGWYLDEDFSREYYFNDEVHESFNLYERWLESTDISCFEFEVINDKLTITSFDKDYINKLIVFPQTIGGQQVKAINKGVHSLDDKYKRVYMIPFGVEEIGESSFKGSKNIDEIFLPRTIKYLEPESFSAARIGVFYFPSYYTEKRGGSIKGQLRDAIINDFYFPGDGKAFKLDSYISLTICNLIMHDDIEVLESKAFMDALGHNILNIKFSESLKILEYDSLTSVYWIVKLELPDSTEKIHPYAFGGGYRVFKIPSKMNILQTNAFDGVRYAYIHSNIEYFEENAFNRNAVLFIDLEGPKDTWDENWDNNYKVYWLKDILGK